MHAHESAESVPHPGGRGFSGGEDVSEGLGLVVEGSGEQQASRPGPCLGLFRLVLGAVELRRCWRGLVIVSETGPTIAVSRH